jgi:hypothetical protein
VPNPSGARSAGLNLSLAATTTQHVCRVDARSLLPQSYVLACVRRLDAHPEVGVVGGHQVPTASGRGRRSRAVARVLADPAATGGAAYRRPSASGSVDTVYLGAFRRDELAGLGGWSEELAANEDFDLCRRFRDVGRIVWLEAGLDVRYEPRDRVGALWGQYSAFGAAKTRYWRASDTNPSLRQWVGLMVPPAVLAAIALATAVRPWIALAACVATIVGLAVRESGRPSERDPVVRAAAALLTPLPAIAFSCGALRAALLRAPHRGHGGAHA